MTLNTTSFAQKTMIVNDLIGKAVAKKIQLTPLIQQDTVNVNSAFSIFGKIFDDRPHFSMQKNYATAHWGWVCQQEFIFQRQTKIPLFLRLGSKNQVDYLEGK